MIQDFSCLARYFFADFLISVILRIFPRRNYRCFEIFVCCVIRVGSVRPSASKNPFLVNYDLDLFVWVLDVSPILFWFWDWLSMIFKDRLLSRSLFRQEMPSFFVLRDPCWYLKHLISNPIRNLPCTFFPPLLSCLFFVLPFQKLYLRLDLINYQQWYFL